MSEPIFTVNFMPLYKRTNTGAIQQWEQEIRGDSWRTISGQVGGKLTASEWHKCYPKNEGKKNATTAEQQALAEVQSNYKKRLEVGYFQKIEDVDNPIMFKPMLAKDYKEYKDRLNFKHGVFSQPKLDGMRCIVTADGMFSRNGKRIHSAPHIWEALNNAGCFEGPLDVVFDGELYNHDLRDDFDTLMSLAKRTKPTTEDLDRSRQMLQYHIYDYYNGTDVDYFTRWNAIVEMFMDFNQDSPIRFVPTVANVHSHQHIDQLFSEYIEMGYEGQMIRTNSPYQNKRTSDLLKNKEFVDEEFEIVDIVEGNGNRAGIAGYLVCRLEDQRMFSAGIKGSHEYARQLLIDRDKYIGGTATVKYFNRTPDNIPRFPVAVYLYEGKRDV